ncbi:glycosyltransferase [Hydrogenophaga sp. 5NK40-0174]|uniref:glycosyltransferase n=1 Tax=Hydrogenophaga sp. 5NK40-0174 TaxID=3127649 RepID=UPI00310C07DA
MKVVVFTHPLFVDSTSMPLFARFVLDGLKRHGVEFQVLTAKAFFHRLPAPSRFKKWLGYIDQYLVFPWVARWRTRSASPDTLFVFTDQALGPWMPALARRPHVVHCHDFLAQRSARGEIPQNPVGRTGRIYQALIQRGFSHARHFICISSQTLNDLNRFHRRPSELQARVVLNGLNDTFARLSRSEALACLEAHDIALDDALPFVLHVGGNQWYKHRDGVLAVYGAYAKAATNPVPLVMVGAPPTELLRSLAAAAQAQGGRVHFLIRPPVEVLKALYSLAGALLFPSRAEGFGWPIAEAMACGCPVLTTGIAPMTEVGGEVATYLPERGRDNEASWLAQCSEALLSVLQRSEAEQMHARLAAMQHARQFDAQRVFERYLAIYQDVLDDALCRAQERVKRQSAWASSVRSGP